MVKRLLLIVALLFCQPAYAQCVAVQGPLGLVTGCTVAPSDGLGDAGLPGIATQGNWSADGFLHVFLYSGDKPYASGYVQVTLPSAFYPPNSTPDHRKRARPGCVATPAWTDDGYTPAGYTNPEPWGLWVGMGAYDNSDATGPTINVLWMGQMPPRVAMSIWMHCTNKTLGSVQ